jgi:thiamine transport system permease protein
LHRWRRSSLVNALMALPFVMRVLEPAYRNRMERNGRLAVSLGLVGLNRLRQIDFRQCCRH